MSFIFSLSSSPAVSYNNWVVDYPITEQFDCLNHRPGTLRKSRLLCLLPNSIQTSLKESLFRSLKSFVKERPPSSFSRLNGKHLIARLFLDELSMSMLSPSLLAKYFHAVPTALLLPCQCRTLSIDPWEEKNEFILLKGYIDFVVVEFV